VPVDRGGEPTFYHDKEGQFMGLEPFRAKSGGPRIGFVGYWESCTERVAFDGWKNIGTSGCSGIGRNFASGKISTE
jgi:hypothetical protein